MIREGENYQRLKPVHTELNNIKFKKQREKFETSHDAELRLFYAARRILKEKLDGQPIALKAWKQDSAQLKTEYPQHLGYFVFPAGIVLTLPDTETQTSSTLPPWKKVVT